MDFAMLSNLGWREGLIAIIAVLVVYVMVVLLRMYRLRHKSEAALAPLPMTAASALAAYGAVQQAPEDSMPSEPVPALGTPEYQFPWNEPPESTPERERLDALEMKFSRLSRDVSALREEVVRLRELAKKQEAVTPPMTQVIAPEYSEAMQLALQDHDAASIAQQCGISRAEADLVVALVRNRDN